MASYYGKRPLWQWLVIYLVIGGIIYAAIYYFILAPKGGYKAPAGGYNYSNPRQGTPPGY